ncbi:MAG TPA: hypothetical protein VNZ53_11460 [Steroidobacteraceae bacterium]|nr:hypothetical protein [Steroidobacteraceae bacterium]
MGGWRRLDLEVRGPLHALHAAAGQIGVFLVDVQRKWQEHGSKVLDTLAKKQPAVFFNGVLALTKLIRWEIGEAGASERSLSPEQIMDKLEERVGPEGRRLFEDFLRKVNKLQAEQQLEASESPPRSFSK